MSNPSKPKKNTASKLALPQLSLKDLLTKSWRNPKGSNSLSTLQNASQKTRFPPVKKSKKNRHKKKYGGVCLYSTQDQWGSIEVIEDRDSRRLHFGNSGIQGRMSIDTPWVPRCTYVESMSLVGCLYEHHSNQKEQILLLGLGSGGLAHTIRRLYPDAHLDLVELRAQVVDVAKRFFKIDDLNAQLHIDDAFHFVKMAFIHKRPLYHLILIDLYLDQGMIPLLFDPLFWEACELLLHPNGLFAVNLWSGDREQLKQVILAIQRGFKGESRILDHEDVGNVIYFGRPSGFNWEYAYQKQSYHQHQLYPSIFRSQPALDRLYRQTPSLFFDLVF